jgi:hypothetical protein
MMKKRRRRRSVWVCERERETERCGDEPWVLNVEKGMLLTCIWLGGHTLGILIAVGIAF